MADQKKEKRGKSPAADASAEAARPARVRFDDEMLTEGNRFRVETELPQPVPVVGVGPEGSFRVSGTGDGGAFPVTPTGPLAINLQRSGVEATAEQPLWVAIRLGTAATRFEAFHTFIEAVLCKGSGESYHRQSHDLLHGVDAYQLLRTAAEAFLLERCGVKIDRAAYDLAIDQETSRLGRRVPFSTDDDSDKDQGIGARLERYLGKGVPYLARITRALEELKANNPFCGDGIARDLLRNPCLIELIWSYWHEEGMLVQAINAVSLRFQNKRGAGDREPLANFEIHPLRPLSSLLWGYIQDEDHRLTVARRAYEYEHHYGLTLVGKAVPKLRPADRRSKFLQAFHNLLHEVARFYELDANTTVVADGFPVLNGLREVHMLLAEGAHNQFRDLPWTARVEMLVQQWLLARPEMTGFLGGRASVPYAEEWMGTVDSLKRLLGWGDTSVTQFHDLAVNGEQILLSIRYGDWSAQNDQDEARNWVRYWRPEIQRYVHAYKAVTGVDLAATGAEKNTGRRIDATQPSLLLQQRAARQRAR